MNKQIKTLLRKRNTFYKPLKRRMINSTLLDKFDAFQGKLQNLINFF